MMFSIVQSKYVSMRSTPPQFNISKLSLTEISIKVKHYFMSITQYKTELSHRKDADEPQVWCSITQKNSRYPR